MKLIRTCCLECSQANKPLLMMMTSAFITSWASDWPVFTSVPVWKMKYVSSFGRRCLAITHRNWEWHGRRNLKVGRRRARIEWVRDVVGPRSFYFSFNRSITVYPSGPSKYVRARLDVRLWKIARLKPVFLWFWPSIFYIGTFRASNAVIELLGKEVNNALNVH